MVTNTPKTDCRHIHFGCHDTRKNLPAISSSKCGEEDFLRQFEAVYFEMEMQPRKHPLSFATGREFAMEGFGRADVVWIAWQPCPDEADFSAISLTRKIQITAIEAKLKDWRKGLQQAARYRYFANRALLVLPPETAEIAARYLDTFKDLQVGLWAFDQKTDMLRKHFTPRSGQPMNELARFKALDMLRRHL